MEYDLDGLGPTQFEHMAQALAVSELGAGTEVFGTGRDGGREATLEVVAGSQGLPGQWAGHLIVQVKHRERPSGDRRDAEWLLKEIKSEFEEWISGRRLTRPPQYYVAISNVNLSSVPRTGGIDRVTRKLRELGQAFGLIDIQIWHRDKVRALLDGNQAVRSRYLAWVGSGDILATLREDQKIRSERVLRAFETFVARELTRQKDVNLTQAGAAHLQYLPIEQVFVDVPAKSKPSASNAEVKMPAAACVMSKSDEIGRRHDGVVLVGGPGQGKSTISQWVCQVLRAQLLVGAPWIDREPELRNHVQRILSAADTAGLRSQAKRWPFHLKLTELADHLARSQCDSILEFVTLRVSKSTGGAVCSTDVLWWLESYPWLLVLDGLDEVPVSSNRGDVLRAIDEFLVDVAAYGADVFVLATTRPQGYSDRFNEERLEHINLTQLNEQEALDYARKLIIAKELPEDRSSVLIRRLNDAATESQTARMMVTPLQIAILLLLLDRLGAAPGDKYSLFAQYYRVIYDREVEKRSENANVLADNRREVDELHRRVGLFLQKSSEEIGAAEGTLSREQLRIIIGAILSEEGYSGAGLETLTEDIASAATDRLVLLVARTSEQVGFDVRSLQEFFAALALTDQPEDESIRAVEAISNDDYWSNVLVFAWGRVFIERPSLRPAMVQLLSEMNLGLGHRGERDRIILLGSQVAIQMLRENSGVLTPRYARLLLDCAAEVLKAPPTQMLESLAAAILSVDGWDVAADYIELYSRLNVGTFCSAMILCSVLSSDIVSARDLALTLISQSAPHHRGALLDQAIMRGSDFLVSLAFSQGWELVIDEPFLPAVGVWRVDNGEPLPLAPEFMALTSRKSGAELESLYLSPRCGFMVASIGSLADVPRWSAIAQGAYPAEWCFLQDSAKFALSLTNESLINALRSLDGNEERGRLVYEFLPWPIRGVLASGECARTIIPRILNREFTDPREWPAIEAGVNASDTWTDLVDFRSPLPTPSGRPIPYFGLESSAALTSSNVDERLDLVERMIHEATSLPGAAAGEVLSTAFFLSASDGITERFGGSSPDPVFEWAALNAMHRGTLRCSWLAEVLERPGWIRLVDQVLTLDAPFSVVTTRGGTGELSKRLLNLWLDSRDRWPLARGALMAISPQASTDLLSGVRDAFIATRPEILDACPKSHVVLSTLLGMGELTETERIEDPSPWIWSMVGTEDFWPGGTHFMGTACRDERLHATERGLLMDRLIEGL